MIEYVFAFMLISLFGSLGVAFMVFAWMMFEETELGQILVEKIKSWFGRDDE